MGGFYYAMKAYAMLARVDENPAVKDGLIASAIAVFKDVRSQRQPRERLEEVVAVLSGEPHAEKALRVRLKYTQQ
jgi:hypothetical protein